MKSEDASNLPIDLESGRQLLSRAHERFGRPVTAEEYWWLGVCLAAITLAELNERSYAVDRIARLMERLPARRPGDDWLGRLVDELSEMEAEGLLWPMYQRESTGPVAPTGLTVQPGFNAESGYLLALAQIAVALAVNREDTASVASLAEVISEMVETGLKPEHQGVILSVLGTAQADT